MNSIILCEGKTDAILLSYYLIKTQGWEFAKSKTKEQVKIPIRNHENEEVNWYRKGDRWLAIWGIGGKDNFEYAISELIKINKLADRQVFAKVVVLRDRDKVVADSVIISEFEKYFAEADIPIDLKSNEWSPCQFTNSFGNQIGIEILTLIILFEKSGALETFLLDAFSEYADEKTVVDAARKFIGDFKSNKYLTSDRLKLKAELGTTFAILHPDKVFTLMDQMLREIPWEKYTSIQTSFAHLHEI